MNCQIQKSPYLLLLFWLTCAFFCQGVLAQESKDLKSSIRGNYSKSLWTEDFSDNKKGWPEYNSNQLICKVQNGKLRLATKMDFPFIMDQETGLRADSEFELSFHFKPLVMHEAGAAGMSFGDAFELFALTLDKFGTVQLLSVRDANVHVLRKKAHGSGWSSNQFHDLTFRQTPKAWEFFLDGSYVFSYPKQRTLGSRAGVFAIGELAIEVGNITLKGIQLPTYEKIETEILVHSPSIEQSLNVFVPNDHQQIIGQVKGNKKVDQILVNGDEVYVNPKGYFNLTKRLDSTVNHIHLSLQEENGDWVRKSFNLIRRKEPGPKPSENNHLLVIGIDRYSQWPNLKNAVKDVRDITQTLINYYDFSPAQVTQILDEDATREKILETLENLQEKLGPSDNLVIYYAGHGYYDNISELGYWVPVDARMEKVPDYIRNSTIHDYLRTINTKHTFLIADACYAGSLFANYRGGSFSNQKSRWAFTSGDIEKVWDGKPGGNSPFAKNLIRYLVNYNGENLPINKLVEDVSRNVSYETTQHPKGSPLKMVGDAGGVLVLKKIR